MEEIYVNDSFMKRVRCKTKILLSFAVISLSACATSPQSTSLNATPQEVAESYSCGEISQKIDQLDEILASVSPSETQKLYKDTAISAAKTGVSLSGVLGAAGPFVNLGVNFMEGLSKVNGKKRQEAIKQAAEEEKFLLLDAYDFKRCVG